MRASHNENSLFCVKLHSVRYFVTSSTRKSVVSKVCRLHVQFFRAFGIFHNSFIFSIFFISVFFIVISDDLNLFAQVSTERGLASVSRLKFSREMQQSDVSCALFLIIITNFMLHKLLNIYHPVVGCKFHHWPHAGWARCIQNFHISQIVGRHRIFQ